MDKETRKIQPKKIKAVSLLKEKFSDSENFILTDYRGLTVGQITDVRRKLREFDASYKVVKNRFAKIAFSEIGKQGLNEFLVGPVGLAMMKGDATAIAKALVGFEKDTTLKMKAALIDGELMDHKQLEAFSKLPTKLELIQMLASVLNENMARVARVLQAVADAKGAEKEASTEQVASPVSVESNDSAMATPSEKEENPVAE